MTPELKTAWLADLRDPANKQCKNRLQTAEGNCCLGRLLIVAGVQPELTGENWRFERALYAPTAEQEQILGLTPEQTAILANLNDLEEKSFPEIADWIEANIQG